MHNGRWNDGMGSSSVWWMAVMMIALVAVVAAAIILFSRRNDGLSQRADSRATPPQPLPQQSPQAILAERLARGEIEPEDYSARLSILLAAPPS